MIETIPDVELTLDDIEELLPELAAYRATYHDLFRRREQIEHYATYLHGLLLDLPNKAIETMMLHLEGDDANAIRRMQHFVSDGKWDDQAILARHWQEVNRDLGDPKGVLIVDGSGFPKQGSDSVGVKRQWCGQLGKCANCQVGVFLAYASRHGYTLLDRRLYLPQEWVEDEAYAARRAQCDVPDEIVFQTKPQLALEMVQAVHATGSLPFRWVVGDEAFGRATTFLDEVARYADYFVEVPHTTQVWRERPHTAVPAWSGQGRKPTQAQLVAGEPAAEEVRDLATTLPAEQCSCQLLAEGSKGPRLAEFAILRVVAVREGLPGPDVWLVLRRDVVSGAIKYFLSNASLGTPQHTLVWLSGLRWPIERCFQDGKQELGLGDYQVRSWTGWHHHMTLCILAHFFLLRVQCRLRDQAPQLTLPQTILLLKAVFPQPQLDAARALEIVNYYQRRHQAAYLSHRRRRLTNLSAREVSL